MVGSYPKPRMGPLKFAKFLVLVRRKNRVHSSISSSNFYAYFSNITSWSLQRHLFQYCIHFSHRYRYWFLHSRLHCNEKWNGTRTERTDEYGLFCIATIKYQGFVAFQKIVEYFIPAWKVITAFSIPRNTSDLFSIRQRSDSIACLDAIRFITFTWVVNGHCDLFVGDGGEYLILIYFSRYCH